jgi:hypothetical protein
MTLKRCSCVKVLSYHASNLPSILSRLHTLLHASFTMNVHSSNNQPPCKCPGLSDSVKQGIIWGVVILLIALAMIIHCWCKDRRQLNEKRTTRIAQQQIQTEEMVRRGSEDRSYRSPPPVYYPDDGYEMDYLTLPARVYDVERQSPWVLH